MFNMMDHRNLKSTFVPLVFTLIITLTTAAFNEYNSDKVLLSDVKALTLHAGQMTNARRSPPVPQLKCVGGSAQYKFTPKVVQCINRGSDGYDIQWECKTDMDNAYRFGQVEVTCEGYDYPNDPYILKGSCGLEYTIDFTEEGLQREKQKNGGYHYQTSYKHSSEGGVSGLLVFAGVLFVMYVIYKTCLAPSAQTPSAPGMEEPPPYGFRPEFMPGQGPTGPPPSYESTQGSAFFNPGYSSSFRRTNPGTGNDGSGFWSGAATGGLLGYLFGRGTGGNNYNRGWGGSGWGWGSGSWGGGSHHHHHYHSGTSSSSSDGGFFSSSSSSGRSSGSSGTRTASGFGGTSRR